MELSYSLWKSSDPKAPRIVLLHGMGGTGKLWRPIAASLENSYHLLAPDQRGHGGSQVYSAPGQREKPGYTPLDYGRDLVETVGSLGFHPTWVIGHSMGVRSACALGHLKPDWVSGLILVDLGFSGVAGGGLGDDLAKFLEKLPMRFASRDEAREFMEKNSPDPSIGQYLMAVSVQTPQKETTFPFDQAALIQTIHAARNASVRTWVRELGQRKMPILVLRGGESQVWSHEEFEQEKTRYADLATIEFREISGTGHGLPFEKRQEFVREVDQFIRSHPR